MTTRNNGDTASIMDNAHCRNCGWPIIDVCANWEYDQETDYYAYCSNKGCKNHAGKPYDPKNFPEDWIERYAID